jgi:hypothetical protein
VLQGSFFFFLESLMLLADAPAKPSEAKYDFQMKNTNKNFFILIFLLTIILFEYASKSIVEPWLMGL